MAQNDLSSKLEELDKCVERKKELEEKMRTLAREAVQRVSTFDELQEIKEKYPAEILPFPEMQKKAYETMTDPEQGWRYFIDQSTGLVTELNLRSLLSNHMTRSMLPGCILVMHKMSQLYKKAGKSNGVIIITNHPDANDFNRFFMSIMIDEGEKLRKYAEENDPTLLDALNVFHGRHQTNDQS